MPIYEVEDNQGNILELEGDSPPTEQELEQIFSQFAPKEKPSFGERVLGAAEADLTLATGAAAEPVAGIAGLIGSVLPGEPGQGARFVENTREALTFQPRTDVGRDTLGRVGEALTPIAETFTDAQQATGDAVFDAAGQGEGAAVAGAIAQGAPDLALAAIPFLGAALRNTKNVVLQSRRAKIAQKIESGSTDNDTAAFLKDGAGKVQKDPVAKESIRQGFDEGVVAAIKGASAADVDGMLRMVSVLDKGRKNARFAAANRPSDIVGDSLKTRIVTIKRANRSAGRRLEAEANSLKGKPVDVSGAVDGFIGELESLGVSFGRDGKLGFKGSDIEGLRGPQAVLNNIVKRMRDTKVPDAFDAHRMKRFIDEQVTFGKDQRGLSGRTENILKSLRHNLDQSLDGAFPNYKRVNEDYAETISALDSFRDVAGKKMDLSGPNADKAIGTLSRRLLSNAQSRITLLDSIDEINRVSAKHGVGTIVPDDILTQVMFVDELGSIFGPAAKTSLQGDVVKAVKTAAESSVSRAALDAAVTGANRLRGINEDAALAAIRRLLVEQRRAKQSSKRTRRIETRLAPQ